MPRSLRDLSTDAVQRNIDVLKQMLREVHPDINLGRGPINDLVVYYAAAFTTALQHDLADIMGGINLAALMRNPNAVSKERADFLLSNWKVKRKAGTPAQGNITIALNRPSGMVIPKGFSVSVGAHVFVTKEPYAARISELGTSSLDRTITKQGNEWTFTIPVVSTTSGSSGNVRRGTQFPFDGRGSFNNIRRIYATHDFAGGSNDETNAEMVQRINRSASGKVWSNRCTAEALICGLPALERAAGVSVVGFGDPEMLRDRHSYWPGSIGGRVDVYVKPASGLIVKDVIVEGQMTDETPDGTTWTLTIGRDCLPGFYYPRSVVKVGGAPCGVLIDTRGIDFAGAVPAPDIPTNATGAYSAYQTCKLVVYEHSPVASGNRFTVSLLGIEGLAEAQALVSATRSPACDVLVKAAMLCETFIIVDIQRRSSDPQVPVDEIRNVITDTINKTSFTGYLSTSTILTAINPLLRNTMMVRDMKLVGQLRYPSGAHSVIEATTVLSIPNEPQHMVSPRTMAFFQDPACVEVAVTTVDV